MYAAARLALRSTPTARPPALFIRRRCHYPLSSSRLQLFHSTRRLAQTPDPSAPPASPGSKPVGPSDADRKDGAREPAVQESDDADVLAQKLQRSRETTRRYSSALKRTQRRNRAQDLPPIYIPEWFLEQRVVLREDSRPPQDLAKEGCTLSLRDSGSGDQGTCSIPFPTSSAAISGVSQVAKALWGRGLSHEQKKQLATDIARSLGQANDAALIEALIKGNDVDGLVTNRTATETDGLGELDPGLDSSNRDKSFHEKEKELAAWLRPNRNRNPAKHASQVSNELSPLLFAEIRAAVAASLAAIHPSSNNTFPSARSNIILHSPENGRDEVLSHVVLSVASQLGADVVHLTAQDVAQLAGDYLGEGLEPSPHSIRNLAYETYRFAPDLATDIEQLGSEDSLADDPETPADDFSSPAFPRGRLGPIMGVSFVVKGLNTISQTLGKARRNSANPFSPVEGSTGSSAIQSARIQTQSEVQLEDLKLTTLLEALVDSNELKRNQTSSSSRSNIPMVTSPALASQLRSALTPNFFSFSHAGEKIEMDLSSHVPPTTSLTLTVKSGPSSIQPQLPPRPRIIHITDIKELNATQNGSRIVQKLEEIVRRQRNAGESIMILGTTCSRDLIPELSANGVQDLQSEGEAGFFRTIVVPPAPRKKEKIAHIIQEAKKALLRDDGLSVVEKHKFFNINIRHIQDMLYSLDPASSTKIADFRQSLKDLQEYRWVLPIDSRALTHDEIHRIAMTALGLHILEPGDEQSTLNWGHLALATSLLKASDETKFAYMKFKAQSEERSLKDQLRAGRDRAMGSQRDVRKGQSQLNDPDFLEKLRQIKATATAHERKLMHGIVNPKQLRTTFDQVHVAKETIEAIRTVTSMSLLRPDAFNYGVLAQEKVSGALLYGPPGTGKTLLAKAVAKESGSTMLEVSGSQIMDKYVGEGEKNVAAIFSLARKMSPCIVFLDEADAIFGTRDTFRERTSHRDILNQFLKEWDGLNDSQVFVMVATNRPFDLDDAVIRRLPRRLLVDLPTQEDRKKILQIHLKDEQLDGSVDLDDLAKRTPLYSGSDLKNIAVFAALACVREENEQAAIAVAKAAAEAISPEPTDSSEFTEDPSASTSTTSATPASDTRFPNTPVLVQGVKYDFPERRTLHKRHLDKAIQEVSASISEDMASLNAIKKFDEQYGDKRNKKKKKAYGFGNAAGTNEETVRVRS